MKSKSNSGIDKEIVGNYMFTEGMHFIQSEEDRTFYEIDIEDLKHSFDGINWYSEDEIKEALEFKEHWRKSMGIVGNKTVSGTKEG
jgi:hypothetical protein